jgi:predicted N-acetyltransferase YhbS
MNRELNKAAKIYLAEIWGKVVGLIAIFHFPHPKSPNIKKVTRLVVLPDYQGVGIGIALLNFMAERYIKQGWRFTITTTHPSINKTMGKAKGWVLLNQFKVGQVGAKKNMKSLVDGSGIKRWARNFSVRRNTCTWEYLGGI